MEQHTTHKPKKRNNQCRVLKHPTDGRPLVSERVIERETGISRYTLRKLREGDEHNSPPFYKFGGNKILYNHDEVINWLHHQIVAVVTPQDTNIEE